MAPIATLTLNPAVDGSTAVDRVTPDDKLRCEPMHYDAGGGGINVARVAARLGEPTRAVFPAGGATGEQLTELLEAEDGIDPVAIRIHGTTRLNVHVDEESTGRQYRFGMPGPEVDEDEWSAALDEVLADAPDLLVASGSLPPGVPDDVYVELCRRAGDSGTRLIVDTSGGALAAIAGAGAYLLKPNARELGTLAGRDLTDETDLEAAARRLAQDGVAEVIVLSLGAGGAYVVTADGRDATLRSPTVPIASRVGAGDSMVAGIAVGLARGWDVLDAARLGIAAGAAAVMTPGTELARADDVGRLHERSRSGS